MLIISELKKFNAMNSPLRQSLVGHCNCVQKPTTSKDVHDRKLMDTPLKIAVNHRIQQWKRFNCLGNCKRSSCFYKNSNRDHHPQTAQRTHHKADLSRK